MDFKFWRFRVWRGWLSGWEIQPRHWMWLGVVGFQVGRWRFWYNLEGVWR